MNLYKAFGLIIQSKDIEIPEFQKIEIGEIDVKIKFTKNKTNLDKFFRYSKKHHFSIGNICDFFILNGNLILIRPLNETVSEDEIKLYLLGSCFGILLQQRGIFCLHASGVVYQNKAFLFIGNSGVGKSSLMSYFYQQGLEVLGDDVMPIIFKDNQPYVVPAYPHVKLWDKSIEKLEIKKEKIFKQLRPNANKYGLLTTEQFHTNIIPLSACIWLDWNEDNQIVKARFSKAERVGIYRKNVYRHQMVQETASEQALFQFCINLAKSVPFLKFSRSKEHHDLISFAQYLKRELNLNV